MSFIKIEAHFTINFENKIKCCKFLTGKNNESTRKSKAQEQGLRHAVSFAVELAHKAGASAEVAVTKVSGLSVSTRLQDIENVEFTNDGALGISVYLGQQKGNASTSDLSENAIKNTVEAALSIAKYTSPDDCTGLADEQLMAFDAPDLALYHPANIEKQQNLLSVQKNLLLKQINES